MVTMRSRSTCSWRPRNAPGGSARIETRTAIDDVARAVPGAQEDARRAAIRALTAPIANGRAVSDCLGRVDTALVRDPQALRNFGLAAHAIGDPPRASALLAEAEGAVSGR